MAEETIYRHVPGLNQTEEVTVPEECVVCPHCGGEGYQSKYDQGWNSLLHSERLAEKHPCLVCRGKGYISALLAQWLREDGSGLSQTTPTAPAAQRASAEER